MMQLLRTKRAVAAVGARAQRTKISLSPSRLQWRRAVRRGCPGAGGPNGWSMGSITNCTTDRRTGQAAAALGHPVERYRGEKAGRWHGGPHYRRVRQSSPPPAQTELMRG